MHAKTIISLFFCQFIFAAYCSGVASAQEEFSSKTIDLGIVVSDINKSVKFYTEAIGMKETGGFKVPGDFAAKSGLTDGTGLDIKVLTLGEGSTQLKLMQLPGVKSKKQDGTYIHSTLGFSYITIKVADTNAAVKRLTKAGVKTLKESPIALPAPLPTNIFLTIVRDPDGNFVELVGPKK